MVLPPHCGMGSAFGIRSTLIVLLAPVLQLRQFGYLTCRRSALSTLICDQLHDQPGMDPVRRALRMSCFIMSCRGCGCSAWCTQLKTWNMGGGAGVAHRLILPRQRLRCGKRKLECPPTFNRLSSGPRRVL